MKFHCDDDECVWLLAEANARRHVWPSWESQSFSRFSQQVKVPKSAFNIHLKHDK